MTSRRSQPPLPVALSTCSCTSSGGRQTTLLKRVATLPEDGGAIWRQPAARVQMVYFFFYLACVRTCTVLGCCTSHAVGAEQLHTTPGMCRNPILRILLICSVGSITTSRVVSSKEHQICHTLAKVRACMSMWLLLLTQSTQVSVIMMITPTSSGTSEWQGFCGSTQIMCP